MNKKGEICIGMAGAGRATELHMSALKRYTGVPVCAKHVIAKRFAIGKTLGVLLWKTTII